MVDEDAARWLVRCRQALLSPTFMLAVLSATVTGLVTGTVRVAQYDSRLIALEQISVEHGRIIVTRAEDIAAFGQRLTAIEQRLDRQDKAMDMAARAMQEMDQRGTSGTGQIARDMDQRIAGLDRRTALLEQQNGYIGEYLRGVIVPAPRKAAH